jgi:hypothetical protein
MAKQQALSQIKSKDREINVLKVTQLHGRVQL